MKRRSQTRITVWPAITDLMTTIVVMAILAGVVGYGYIQQDLGLSATRDHILGKLANRLKDDSMEVDVRYDEGVIRLHESIIGFISGGESPIPQHRRNVGLLAQVLAEVVPCHIRPSTNSQIKDEPRSDRPNYCQPTVKASVVTNCGEQDFSWLLGTILIEGHTDTRRVGESHRLNNNLELSSVRAASVYNMITDCEPSLKEIRNKNQFPVFSTSGHGEMRLADTTNSGLNKSNRRIELRLLLEPDSRKLP